jgi:lipoate-protein ligase A
MQFVNYLGTDAYTNIATDAWMLNNLKPKEPVFALWQNKNAIIIGQNQNTFAEVNQEYVDEKNIQVVRRVTGGGAVYHDLGNLNFTFIVPVESTANVDFSTFVKPMLDALISLGIPAEINGRNDLVIDGKKVSGNAQRYAGGYLMHHGTLLFNSDVDVMVRSLNVADEKFISKAAKSVRSRVGAIKDSKPDLTIAEFKDRLEEYLSNGHQDKEIILTPEQIEEIKNLRETQFATWNWNYGKTPQFQFMNHAKFDGGSIDVRVDVNNGKITDIDFGGDFLGVRDWREIKDKFIDLEFSKPVILNLLNENSDSQYFGSITNEEVAETFNA